MRASFALSSRLSGRSACTTRRASVRGANGTVRAMADAAGDFYPHGLESLSPATTVEKTLQRLGSKFEVVPLPGDSAFVRPASILYELDGKQRRWDIIQAHSSVACVLYHKDMDAFLLVRQFRPAVYAHRLREAAADSKPAPGRAAGFTIELCAGLVDKAKSLPQIVVEEIHEEVGYAVAVEGVVQVSAAVAAAGNNGATSTMFYAEIDNSQRVNAGGGLESTGEAIEVLALPFSSVPRFVTDASIAKSTGLMFGLLWAHNALLSGELTGRAASMEGGALSLKATAEADALLLKSVLPS
ncbi:NUDIX hydrolase domain-like protein [Scenedesmus sp. NREL 46B-D3]|nr:NUDIX hydrolase domain-like protein [Scenedesmus sp. NREL 46B-D3]